MCVLLLFLLVSRGAQHNRVDLHGLYVKEALETIEERIQNGEPGKLCLHESLCVSMHMCVCVGSVLYVITGKGSHSRDGQARIKPAVLRYLQEHHIRCVAHLCRVFNGLILQVPGAECWYATSHTMNIESTTISYFFTFSFDFIFVSLWTITLFFQQYYVYTFV